MEKHFVGMCGCGQPFGYLLVKPYRMPTQVMVKPQCEQCGLDLKKLVKKQLLGF